MNSLSFEIADLKDKVSKKITHSYIKNQIKKPKIDLDKLFILNELYKNTSMSRSQKEDYIVVIMLIDIALKTHDLVNGNNYNKATDKQLTVLVGDYYSGMYYYLLAQLEDVEMINKLASSIKLINEEKMNLHYATNKSEDDVYQSLLNSETELFTKVAKINHEYESIPFIESFLMLNRLKAEKSDKNSILNVYYKTNDFVKNNHSINDLIEYKMNDFKIKLDTNLNKLSRNYSDYIYSNTFDSIQTNISQVEEG